MKAFEGIHGLRPDLDFHHIKMVGDELEEFLKYLCAKPEILRDTRVIVSDTEIEVCQLDGNGRALFVVSSSDTPSYAADDKDQTKFNIAMRPSWMGKFIFDYFAEIYLANSVPAVRRFIADEKNGGLAGLYERKNKFVKKEISRGAIPDNFKSGASKIEYACFHNSVRTTSEPFEVEQTRQAIELWDKFIVEELTEYLTTVDTLKDDLKGWKRVSGQLSQERLRKRMTGLDSGAYLILKQKKTSQIRTPEKTAENVRTVLEGWSRRSNLNKGFAIIGADEIRNDSRARLIHRLIDSNYLQAFRIWIK